MIDKSSDSLTSEEKKSNPRTDRLSLRSCVRQSRRAEASKPQYLIYTIVCKFILLCTRRELLISDRIGKHKKTASNHQSRQTHRHQMQGV